jgi:hypothetical protein
MMRLMVSEGVGERSFFGRDERSASPDAPSAL